VLRRTGERIPETADFSRAAISTCKAVVMDRRNEGLCRGEGKRTSLGIEEDSGRFTFCTGLELVCRAVSIGERHYRGGFP
jgi:hypothetical protein